ncbi:hypothetical protein BDV38DRAFT_250711 [Aspergillus pseudotamarii]|uniref:Uncharacterized protein n=1 Tax=Aspergillus pseudotamarii TaxID=132259 RepID=A0A5N6SQA6_ASPPS|nr:uncharacterized protein BDV38DRAFT_250711 [Aspergillus pseudotamarii]KAE8135921.1 hypothetical protein BDV38DRAFT_250711 [Aspergillus pseudotamarii]
MADESKPVKVVHSWWMIFWTWAMQLYFVLYINTLRWMLSLLLVLTPTLWGPRLWFALLGASMTEQPVYLGDTVMNTMSQQDSDGQCKTWTEKREAILNSASSASGWYGPGAYLAWLITAYATALSTIWHSKCSEGHPDVNKLDAEILLTIGYPLVALGDVLLRLVRCQIDPGMTAAVFVLVSTLTVIGPLTRLSWQEDGVEVEIDPPNFPRTVKEWTWKTFRFLCHTVVYAILFEPYLESRVMLAVYVLLFVTVLYSGIYGEARFDKYPYRRIVYRPRGERMVVFCVVQLVFNIVLFSVSRSVWPKTDASLLDLDQAAGVFLTTSTLVYSRREGIMAFVKWLRCKRSTVEVLSES